MRRSASRPEEGSYVLALVGSGLAAVGSAIARNPAIAGGTTAFLIALFFVSANAIWYQPHFHDGAFFTTRASLAERVDEPANEAVRPRPRPVPPEKMPAPDTATTGAVPDAEASTGPGGDALVSQVQTVLADLGLYGGPVDGLKGPNTQAAIENYQRIVGIEVTGDIDAALLRQLGIGDAASKDVPAPTPRPEHGDGVSKLIKTASHSGAPKTAGIPKEAVKRIQAGLRAFGNDGIEIDGVVGEDTRAAIREFQSLFGLPVTGEPDAALLAKMKEIGLTN